MPNRTSMAPAALYSFMSQSVYFATYLLKYNCFDCTLSLENIGDVGSTGEINEIVELKNAQYELHNPLTNSSMDLWKSLFNWTMFFYENSNYDVMKFRLLLFINTTNNCNADLAKDINECCDYISVESLIKRIKSEILRKPNYRRKKLSSIRNTYKNNKRTVKYFVESLLSSELVEIFKKVCIKFEYEVSQIDYYTQLINLLKINYGCEDGEKIGQIAYQLVGWVETKIVNLLREKTTVIIGTKEFGEFSKKQIAPLMFPNKYSMHPTLKPKEEDIEEAVRAMPRYLKQLELIGLTGLFAQSASYYLQLMLERKNWIKSGFLDNVEDLKYTSYQDSLYKNWEFYREILNGDNEEEKGKSLLMKMLDQNNNKFDNEILDIDLTRGFIHELADLNVYNKLSIGWHPKYKELLDDGK